MCHDDFIEVFLHVLRFIEEVDNAFGVPGGLQLVASSDDPLSPEQVITGVGRVALGCASKYPVRPAYELESLVGLMGDGGLKDLPSGV